MPVRQYAFLSGCHTAVFTKLLSYLFHVIYLLVHIGFVCLSIYCQFWYCLYVFGFESMDVSSSHFKHIRLKRTERPNVTFVADLLDLVHSMRHIIDNPAGTFPV